MLTYCDQGTGGKFRCAVCTAKSAAATMRCANFNFTNTDYSFAAEPTNRCYTCTDTTDILYVLGSTDYFGECLASGTDMTTKCTSNGYRVYYTDAKLAYCGDATAGVTKCI